MSQVYKCTICKKEYNFYEEAEACVMTHSLVEQTENTEDQDTTVNAKAGRRPGRKGDRYTFSRFRR